MKEIRTCNTCKQQLPLKGFYKDKSKKSGYRGNCKTCIKNYNSDYRSNNKEYFKKYRKENYEYFLNKNKERDSKEYHKKYQRDKRNSDPLFKLKGTLRNRIYIMFKFRDWKKNKHTEEILGADYEFVKQYIESTFVDGMSWENHGEWHIDHKIPLDSANNEQELYKLCHYTNLQALWAFDNLSKSNKI